LRIVSGTARGRRLHTPRNSLIRPTSDRVKEALFNILAVQLGSFDGCRVLDIFAGTGNLGIEALSRGADFALFMDRDRDALSLVEKNLRTCGFAERARIVATDALAGLRSLEKSERPFRIVFVDPPYGAGLAEKVLECLGCSPLVDENSVVVVEISRKDPLPADSGNLREFDRRHYGDTVIAFFGRLT
jgi:16S rRNA (guanine(966)-N(2))-methyltransferase RsmD